MPDPINPLLRSPLTPQKVVAILKAAGFEPSKKWATRVKGWHNRSHGFTAWKVQDRPGEVCVDWRTPPGYGYHKAELTKKLMSLADALRKEGIEVQLLDDLDRLMARYPTL